MSSGKESLLNMRMSTLQTQLNVLEFWLCAILYGNFYLCFRPSSVLMQTSWLFIVFTFSTSSFIHVCDQKE